MISDDVKDVEMVQKFNLEALEKNYSLEKKWKEYKQEYEELKINLNEFPKELSAPILMPLGSKVFVRAQLCNTNEVFIRYNDIFTKQTAFEAQAVCERNIERCKGMIENLEREKKMLSDNFLARQEIITNHNFCTTQENINSDMDSLVDLNEPYNAEAEAAWKERHKQKVKEYKQQLAEEKKNILEREKKSDTKCILNNKEAHVDEIDSDDCSTNESCDDESIDDEEYEEDIIEDDEDDEDNDDSEDSEEDDSKLEIVFTNDIPETTRNFRKNIKKKVSFNNEVEIKEFIRRPEELFIHRKEEVEEIKAREILVTEIDDIKENVSDMCLNSETDNDDEIRRPISKFKASRNKSNNNK